MSRHDSQDASQAPESDRKEPRQAPYTVAQLKGIVPALPGRETIDFEDFIAEAMEEKVESFERR